MTSESLDEFRLGLNEVLELQKANTTRPGGFPDRPEVVRAINRASVVLLYSHFERYFRRLEEEVVSLINDRTVSPSKIPEEIRLEHSKARVEELARREWTQRATAIKDFLVSDGWLWVDAPRGEVEHLRLLTWMKSVSPDRITRFYRRWGIDDIFKKITRTAHTRNRLWLRLKELDDKRHNIAHGDFTAEATSQDIGLYVEAVSTFARRADKGLWRRMRALFGVEVEWYER